MKPAGGLTLGRIADHRVLEVSCKRCERRGRFRTARMVADHWPDLPMPSYAADCSRMTPCGSRTCARACSGTVAVAPVLACLVLIRQCSRHHRAGMQPSLGLFRLGLLLGSGVVGCLTRPSR